MDRISFPEWRDEQRKVKYPLAADATLFSQDGHVLPLGLLLDAKLYPIGWSGRLYLSQLTVDYKTVTFSITDSLQTVLITGSQLLTTPSDTVPLHDIRGRTSGVLVIDPTQLIVVRAWGAGNYVFDEGSAAFVMACCIPVADDCVRGFVLEDGSLVTGNCWLVGDNGVVLSVVQVERQPAVGQALFVTGVRVDVVGDPLFVRHQCQAQEDYVAPNPLRGLRVINRGQTFNVLPDAPGHLRMQTHDGLVSHPALRISSAESAISFSLGRITNNG